MENSKLIFLLKTFNTQELREFKDFVGSPFFNKNEDVVRLYAYLKKQAPDFKTKKIAKEKMYQQLFPKQTFDAQQLYYLMSFLLKLAEEYIGYREYQEQATLPTYHILASFVQRNLDKHYEQTYRKATQKLAQYPFRDANYYYQQYLLADIANRHFRKQKVRKFDERLQTASDYFDYYYLSNKLQYSAEMLDRNALFSGNYKAHLLEELKYKLQEPPYRDIPSIRMYWQLLELKDEQMEQTAFEHWEALMERDFALFSEEEQKQLFYHAINYCIRKIREEKEWYVAKCLDLYTKGVEQRIVFEDGYLSPWTFINTIRLAARLQRYEWASQFIYQQVKKLKTEFQHNALHYNLADIFFYQGAFDKAQEHLFLVEYTDLQITLNTKARLLQIYFETKEEEMLLSGIAAFKLFLKRNKHISDQIRTPYLIFSGFLEKILKLQKTKTQALISDIQTAKSIFDRKWLLEKCGA